ncbi:MAG: permease-like cell division protein FtsX [bacterium]|nr:permease-like cell division protein FtsX [bacterium]
MNRVTFGRIIKNGLTNYWRNFWLSAAATAIMVITLFILGSLLILSNLASISSDTLREKVDISVYFRSSVNEQTILQIQRQIELLPEVKSISYIPPVQAREKFIQLHQNEPLLIESVEQFSLEDNPFPASVAIRVHDLRDYPKIIKIFSEDKFTPFVKKITDKRDVVRRLDQITTVIKNLGLGLAIFFGVVTLIVMFNTIRLTIYSRREEIEIMRLVGASNAYIRGPFIIEGLAYGLAGTILTVAILFPLLYFATPKISGFLELPGFYFGFIGEKFGVLAGLLCAYGVFLGMISAVAVVRKYLKV